jgi:hypothetical protein
MRGGAAASPSTVAVREEERWVAGRGTSEWASVGGSNLAREVVATGSTGSTGKEIGDKGNFLIFFN